MPAVLTLRLSQEEQRILARRSKLAGMRRTEFVRKLIRGDEIVVGADLTGWANKRAGDKRLRVTPLKRRTRLKWKAGAKRVAAATKQIVE